MRQSSCGSPMRPLDLTTIQRSPNILQIGEGEILADVEWLIRTKVSPAFPDLLACGWRIRPGGYRRPFHRLPDVPVSGVLYPDRKHAAHPAGRRLFSRFKDGLLA